MSNDQLTLSDIQYREEIKSERGLYSKFAGMMDPDRSPVLFQKPIRKLPTIDNIAPLLGFSSDVHRELLAYHGKRLVKHGFIAVILLLAGSTASLVVLLQAIPIRTDFGNPYIGVGLLFYLITFLMYALVVPAFRLAALLSDKYFADSLCVEAIIHLLFMLRRDNVLIRPDYKSALQWRVGRLARFTALLPFRYRSRNDRVQEWTQNHFRHLESYIRERERWIVSPTAQTLAELRQDLHGLADMYLFAAYGSFSWQDAEEEYPPLQPTFKQRIVETFARLFWLLATGLIFIFVLTQPEYLKTNHIDPTVSFWISLALLSVAIDATFKLGAINGVISVAKGYRDLTR
jgi:hypothetical protein